MPAAVRSFHDLRAFAAEAAPASGDDWLAGAHQLPLADPRLRLVALLLPAGTGAVAACRADAFAIVLEGDVAITGADGRVERLAADDSVVLPMGAGFTWASAAGARVIVMAYAAEAETGRGPVRIDRGAALARSNPPTADLLVGETPSCRNHTDFTSADGTFLCGVWDSTPYHRRPMRYRHHELMHLLAGAVTVVDETGREATFVKGDVFLVEAGASCSWESREDVAKVYAIHRPA
ncbi:DUF861 domain-containing protein [Methylobacterium nonmethylotrophicum]|uniref:DUF861 domain-containing protein n=2 Tax=Methylobacterium nonmethylotrophicum TaxID=1141884 RepID=A0A4Z0NJA7_9HYPH|nr:DUF861 domain-containing protein [Methylobacterium nonmethylotrophicum]